MTVSIIIPCFNHASTLERAVVSALSQTDVAEVVVVDDASVDNSVEIALILSTLDERVMLLRQEDNSGPSVARNLGVAHAAGAFISFLDADDELLGDFIGTALDLFRTNPRLIVAKCDMEFIDPIKGYILPESDPRYQAAVLSSSCGMVIRREHFFRLGGFPEDPIFRGPLGGEDVAFMQAVSAHFQPIARIKTSGYRVWSRNGSHLDRFLSVTRLCDDGTFEFISESTQLSEGVAVSNAITRYLYEVSSHLHAVSHN